MLTLMAQVRGALFAAPGDEVYAEQIVGIHSNQGDLKVNETHTGPKLSNTRGTAAIAHWDVPDCGNSEFFINLQTNAHLEDAYGGYCVFAEVAPDDAASFAVVDQIAGAIKTKQKVAIISASATP